MLNIPMPGAMQYYVSLLENDKSTGSYEQKMLVLRRRFDRILREVTGPFHSGGSFYKISLEKIQDTIRPNGKIWNEVKNMHSSFNTVMHYDIDVDENYYKLALQRLSRFISLISSDAIPEQLKSRYLIEKGFNMSSELISVFCCIDGMSLSERSIQVNEAALKFRNKIITDKRFKEKILFNFIIARSDSVYIRDLSNRPNNEPIKTGNSRELALTFALKNLENKSHGMLIILYGGDTLHLQENELKIIRNFDDNVLVIPISLSGARNVYPVEFTRYKNFDMIEGCYEEFFNWLYDCMILHYLQ